MSDQRRVIYEQRLDIMKSANIYGIVDDIFKEIIDNILLQSSDLGDDPEVRENFKVKVERICGIKMLANDFSDFILSPKEKKIQLLENNFKNKRTSRIEKISDGNNQDVERKIFLQNWRLYGVAEFWDSLCCI